MANSTKQRLKYTDSNGDTQIIGVINGPGDEKGLSRAQLFHRVQQYDKLTSYGDVKLKRKIPQDNTEIQGEPFIFYETYDPDTDSWTTRFRGWSEDGGKLNRQDETKLKMWSAPKFYGQEEVTLDPEEISKLNQTNNKKVMEQAVSNVPNVVIDAPTEQEVQNNSDQNGYIEMKRYAMRNQERGRIFYEMTKILGWVLKPTGEKDGSGNWKWRYEPEGYGGTVDTIQDSSAFQFSASESRGKIRNWIFEDQSPGKIINVVEIKNTSSSSRKSIVGVDTGSDTFTVNKDLTGVLSSGDSILVTDSTGNDGTYSVSSVSYDSNNDETDIDVNQNVSNSTADGILSVGAGKVLGRYSAGSEPSPNSVDRYGERYKSHQVNFLEGGTEADKIAERIVDKNKDAGEGGNVKASPRYEGNEVNNSFAVGSRNKEIYVDLDIQAVDTGSDTFTVNGNVTGNLSQNDQFDVRDSTGNDGTYTVDSLNYDSNNNETDITVKQNVSDSTADGQARIYAKVFTARQQINHYPENSTDFTFTFERETESEAVMAENLRAERNQLYPDSEQDVGNQKVNSNTQGGSASLQRDTDASVSANSKDSPVNIKKDKNTGIEGVETDQGYFFGNYTDDIASDNGDGWTGADTYIQLSSSYDYLFHACHVSFFVEFNPDAGQTALVDIFVRLYNRSTGEYFPTSDGIRVGGLNGVHTPPEYNHVAPSAYLHAPFNWIGDDIQLEYDISIGGGPSIINMAYAYHGSRGHIHDDDIEVTSSFEIIDTFGSDTFQVRGDVTDKIDDNDTIEVVDSTGNDGTYTVFDVDYDSSQNETDIEIDNTFPDSTDDGYIINQDNSFTGQKPQTLFETNPEASVTTQPVFSEDGSHFHLVDTTTEAKNLNLQFLDKDDR